jgi:membrane protein DedA with SNARE-associated domain
MEALLLDFSETHRILSYIIISLGVLVEGEIVLLLAGVLSHRGYLDIFDVIFIAFLAAIVHDLIYWSIGKKLAESNKKKILFVDLEKVKRFIEKSRNRSGLYVFITKFTWSFNRIALIASGFIKTPLKELLKYSLPACLIWAITFVSLGYIFASETDIFKKDIKTAVILISGFIIFVVILENLLRRQIKRNS